MTLNIVLSLCVLIATTLLALFLPKIIKNKHNFKRVYVLLAGMFLAILCIMLFVDNKPGVHGDKTTVFLAIFHTIQVLLLGYDFEFLYEAIKLTDAFAPFLFWYMSLLFFLAPIYTFSFVLSFFESISAHVKYAWHFFSDIFVLSDLSEKSLTLAKSIREKFPKALIVITNSTHNNEVVSRDFLDDATNAKALIFSKNISDVSLWFHSKKSRAVFFVMNENETLNLEASLSIIDKFSERENTELYVFSTLKEGELLLDSIDTGCMKVRRVGEDRSLAYSIIDTYPITDNVTEVEGKKIISSLIVGFGGYGSELAKALLWCGQLPGYDLEINVIDKNPHAETNFKAECPEIFTLNNNTEDGEARYSLSFFNGIDVYSHEFTQIVSSLKNTSVVYVSLGNDERNMQTAINLRIAFERIGLYPVIRSIVYSNIKYKMLQEHSLLSHNGMPYDIEIIGNTESRLSYDMIINEKLDSIALEYHLVWATDKEAATRQYNRFEYYRSSSIATAIHEKYRKRLNLSPEVAEIYEHMRWNAFMRTEGFVFSGSKEKASRNDRAKTHNNLHRFGLLSDEDIEKDRRIIKLKNSAEQQ